MERPWMSRRPRSFAGTSSWLQALPDRAGDGAAELARSAEARVHRQSSEAQDWSSPRASRFDPGGGIGQEARKLVLETVHQRMLVGWVHSTQNHAVDFDLDAAHTHPLTSVSESGRSILTASILVAWRTCAISTE